MQERNRQPTACTVVACRMHKIAISKFMIFSRVFPNVRQLSLAFMFCSHQIEEITTTSICNETILTYGEEFKLQRKRQWEIRKLRIVSSYRNPIFLCHHHPSLRFQFHDDTSHNRRRQQKKLCRSTTTTQRRKKEAKTSQSRPSSYSNMKIINWTLDGISIYCNSSLVSHELWWITFSRYNIFIYWINCKTHDASSEPHEKHKTLWCGLLFFDAEQQKKRNVK